MLNLLYCLISKRKNNIKGENQEEIPFQFVVSGKPPSHYSGLVMNEEKVSNGCHKLKPTQKKVVLPYHMG